MKVRRLGLTMLMLLGLVSAHDSQSAGSVQVTLFTDADDLLRIQAPTRISFSFLHLGRPLTACRCRVLLYRGTPSARVPPLKDLYLGPLQQGEGNTVLDGLPEGGYTLVLDGRPIQFGDFDAFRMRYVLRAGP
ncbi:hypothetical protein [Deinococcus sp.]|uniref:hypothetical protein n=1 Tax=Deinococcus sp. TaxID=47478 RepID=UPI003C7E1AE3